MRPPCPKTASIVRPGHSSPRKRGCCRVSKAAWESGGPPNLADYCPDRQNRLLLLELILIDMERRAKAGLQPRVEGYFEQFPELKGNDDDILELVLAELRLRKMKLRDKGLDECRRRFPQLAERCT